MLKLSSEQLNTKLQFIDDYINAENAATGAKFDANANVGIKNIATLEAEINKDINIQINRALVSARIEHLFGTTLAEEYNRQINDHEIYVHDETSLKPYCVSISMYPLLNDGMTSLGGESLAPEHLESFCGSFINLVFAVSSQFAGAIATVEFLMYFDYFARKDYGDNYLETHSDIIKNHFQHIVYSINQPAAARGYQSVFWNISLFDKTYFNSMFENFVFLDFEKPSWCSVDKLQKFFMSWFNIERKKAVLTFPVITAAMLVDKNGPTDLEFEDFCADELSKGNSFFIYQSESADSLASCCRLRNEVDDNTFSYSLGAGGVATGSINVITINMNRLVQKDRNLKEEISKIHKYQVAYRSLIDEYKEKGMLPVYDAGYITLDKQFLTIGINGMLEAAEYLGITPQNNDMYKSYVSSQLKVIYNENRRATNEFGHKFNTEFVPAENLGAKNARWDKRDGLITKRDCYNSYFYAVEDDEVNHVDKFILHGRDINKYLDGGSALHLNLEEQLTKENYKNLLRISARTGCNYFCTNIKVTICNDCHHIDKRTMKSCSKCSSQNIDYGTRVIGYLKRVSSFSNPRQKEHDRRHYHNTNNKQASAYQSLGM
jgi:ribonucleoside-triphosphate reductase